jgi:hypothetical protein
MNETVRRLAEELELTQARMRTLREESAAANEELREELRQQRPSEPDGGDRGRRTIPRHRFAHQAIYQPGHGCAARKTQYE